VGLDRGFSGKRASFGSPGIRSRSVLRTSLQPSAERLRRFAARLERAKQTQR
jgi:hypothetical protein